MKTIARDASDLVGTFRSFGCEGPVYEVLREVCGEKVRIVLVETGEELDYLVARALKDPEVD